MAHFFMNLLIYFYLSATFWWICVKTGHQSLQVQFSYVMIQQYHTFNFPDVP